MVLGKIALTGSTGMLGRHLQAVLENVGAEVIGVSRSHAIVSARWDLREWLDFDALDVLFPNVQAVVHAGAFVQPSGQVDTARMFDANVRACLNLGEWAISRNIPLLYVSGAIVYADNEALFQKESAELGWGGLGGFYGFSKLLAEDVFMRLRQQGLRLAVIRPTSIYGAGITSDKIIRRFLTVAEQGGTIDLLQPVDDRVDIIHATDVSRAVVSILKRDEWDVFNLSSGHPVSIKELAQACISLTGRGDIAISGNLIPNYRPVTTYSLDIEHAAKRLDWQPVIDFQTGLNMLRHDQLLAPLSSHQSMSDPI